MSTTREVVREIARVARDLSKGHPLTQELSAELFAQKGIGASESGSQQHSSNSRRVGWRVCRKSGYKRIKAHGTYHVQLQTLYTPSQL